MIRFEVLGVPQPGGSKSAFPLRHRDGSPVLRENGSQAMSVRDANPKVKDWRVAVVAAARRVHTGALLDGPLSLRVLFRFPRPKGHYTPKGVLRRSAPMYPAVKPDTTKLLRSLEDALSKVLWRDDTLIVDQWAVKVYGEPAGALVLIVPAPPGLEAFTRLEAGLERPTLALAPALPPAARQAPDEALPLFAAAGGAC